LNQTESINIETNIKIIMDSNFSKKMKIPTGDSKLANSSLEGPESPERLPILKKDIPNAHCKPLVDKKTPIPRRRLKSRSVGQSIPPTDGRSLQE
jgi:hypothetical protein